ncbi:MAG: phosphoribosylamine--glycine ligase [Acidobacteria bacterium]|nr:phosphoribosylamine--glycine ligase [Acidobacteriota bacterium]
MKVLVVGGGAREHALVWKLAAEPGVDSVVCAPGNVGISRTARCVPVTADDPAALLALIEREHIDFTVIGPELPLTRGVVNILTRAGHPCCGPSREAARLESSKAFAKDVMARCGVPTARHLTCDSAAAALDAVSRAPFGYPVVLKADGLAAGKGVVIAPDRAAAAVAIHDMMVERRFGEAGAQIVIEEHLQGRETSFFVLTDGVNARVLPSAEDHKRAYDGDEGPNTGGMGAFCPSPMIDTTTAERILDQIVLPTLGGMAAAGNPYRGFLYCGLMMTTGGPRVIEFNARLGDPETQVMLPAIDEDLLPHLVDGSRGALKSGVCRVRAEAHVGVVMASGGYPGRFETGKTIGSLAEVESLPDVWVFHAGTAQRGETIVTNGGRVLTVVGRGRDFQTARTTAYDAVSRITFDDAHFRRDIGLRAIEGEAAPRVGRGGHS